MGLIHIASGLRKKYQFEERDHAIAILAEDFPDEWADLIACLDAFWLKKSAIMTPGGGRSPIPIEIDSFLQASSRGWIEKKFDSKFVVDGVEIPNPTHKIDNFKNRVAVEVEWNNKTEFYDRDLNNFRILRQLKVLSVGVIITRLTELQGLFNSLGKGKSYGNSTTHWDKLIPKVDGGGAGGCPLLLVGMGMACYRPKS
jgi:Restriction endonuclease BglII